jgi:hypothetical protein
VAHYANLAPGRYRFVVTASNDRMLWSTQTPALEIDLRPRFFQTPWFRGLAILGLGVSGLGCELGQGHLFGRPMEREAAAAWQGIAR